MAGTPKRRARNAIQRRAAGLAYREDLHLVDVTDPAELQALLSETLTISRDLQRDVHRKYLELKGKLRYQDDHGAEQLRSEVAVLERSLERTGRTLISVAQVGVERLKTERQRADERMTQALVDALLRAIEDPAISLTSEQKHRIRERAAAELLGMVPNGTAQSLVAASQDGS